jgi:RND superfamily putative drug exporter
MRFAHIGQFLVRRRWWVLVLTAVFFVGAGIYGGDVAKKLSNGGFSDPSAESSRAEQYLDETLGSGTPNVVLLVKPTADGATVDDAAVAAAGKAVTDELATAPGVTQSVSYWSLGNAPPLKATDGSSALVLARTQGSEDEVREHITAIAERFDREGAVVTTQVGGMSEAFAEVGHTIEKDLALAEMIALPITLLILLFVFRSPIAASLPLLVGGFSIVGTFVVLKVLASMTDVSIFALNLTTALGLGLAIDYSLLLVSRYREERGKGKAPNDAVVHTVATAGRAVVFSGITVAISLGALLLFPVSFLKSFAYAGIGVVVMAVLGAVVVLPAMLAALGDRVDKFSIPRLRRGRRANAVATDRALETTFWYRVAMAVMKRPVPVAGAVIALLLVLGLPFLHMATGTSDDRVLPTTATARQVGDTIRADYSSKDASAMAVVFPVSAPDADALDPYAAALSKLDGVSRVDAPTGIYLKGVRLTADPTLTGRYSTPNGPWVSVVPTVEPMSAAGEQLVKDVRATPAPAEALVGGPAAQLVDLKAGIMAKLPWALGFIALSTFVLLFLSFGSILVPVKALVLNTLSLTATFGAMVWIFQDGHLADQLGFTPTGTLDLTMPILMFCIAFGLSMDYEVFLLSRIKEEHDRTGDNTQAVAVGLARTGRIITAAAATIAVVFLAFATSSIAFIKLFGIGLTLAVLMDATIVRATLVPAFMRLAGEANWWAPRWMRRIYDRAGMSEAAAEAALLDLTEIDRDEDAVVGTLVGMTSGSNGSHDTNGSNGRVTSSRAPAGSGTP